MLHGTVILIKLPVASAAAVYGRSEFRGVIWPNRPIADVCLLRTYVIGNKSARRDDLKYATPLRRLITSTQVGQERLFQSGNFDVENEHRSGRPVTDKVDAILEKPAKSKPDRANCRGFQSRNTEISVFRDPASFFSPACCGITCAGSRSICGTVKKHAHDHSRPRTVGFSIYSYSSMGRLLTASAARLDVSLPIVKYSSFASNSFVWEHFLKSEDGLSAKCKRCKTVIKTTARSTKGLHVHLKAKHQIEDLNKKVPENAVSSSSVSTNLSMLSRITVAFKEDENYPSFSNPKQ
ncbi:hypothetical protein EVAR_74656_1 [Eumeta japonica]|uniref:BED-type domain-containing protein n=1 Tax=Eumeta variegata TaxID=151549 RepID=A0A4C1WAS8_EUMVA|nr:hypothetical protein EVAR_74656_1 [Eumeta japonica]